MNISIYTIKIDVRSYSSFIYVRFIATLQIKKINGSSDK